MKKLTLLKLFLIYSINKHQLGKYVHANEAPFLTKELHKAIVKGSRLRNKFLKDRTENNQKNFKLQRIFCKKLLRTTKKSYYSLLNIKQNFLENIRKTLISLFTKRPLKGEKFNFIENGKNISNDAELFNIFNGIFSNIVSEFN